MAQRKFLSSRKTATGFISGKTFGPKKVEYAVVGGMAVFEGDIILGTEEEMAAPAEPAAAPKALVISGDQFRWPGGVIPYEIEPDLPSPRRVTGAIEHWESRTPIRFVKRTNQKDWVRFRRGRGCTSPVGRRGGMQFISLANGCNQGAVIHEIGHAVGLWHEHSREDRDQFVEIFWDNIEPGNHHNFRQNINDGDDVGPYDYLSVMHYPPNAFAINRGLPTIKAKPPGQIGRGDRLSAGDIAAVKALYGERPAEPTGEPATGAPGTSAEKPVAIDNAAGGLEVFARGADRQLWRLAQSGPDNAWGEWRSLGGENVSQLAAGRQQDGRITVFAKGPDGALWIIQETAPGGDWSDWRRLGRRIQNPAVIAAEDGRLEVFARSEGVLWRRTQERPNGEWKKWQKIGGEKISELAAGRQQDGRITVFAKGQDGALWIIQEKAPGGDWSDWRRLGRKIWNPAVVSTADGRLEVFVRSDDDLLWRRAQKQPNGGEWLKWEQVGGKTEKIVELAAGVNGEGRIEVYATRPDRSLLQIGETGAGGAWSDWVALGGKVTGPAVARGADGRLAVFGRGSDNAVWRLLEPMPAAPPAPR